jgi:hypothetical protein
MMIPGGSLQEKVYLFVVAVLKHDSAPATSDGKQEDAILAAELLVPTICVSKRNRGTGSPDYIAQAVSNLGYNWNEVSAAGLY